MWFSNLLIREMLIHLSFVRCVCVFNRIWFFATPWTIAHLVPLSVGSTRQEYWSRFLFPSPGDLPEPGMEPVSFTSPALAGRFFTTLPPEYYWLRHFRIHLHNKLPATSVSFSKNPPVSTAPFLSSRPKEGPVGRRLYLGWRLIIPPRIGQKLFLLKCVQQNGQCV